MPAKTAQAGLILKRLHLCSRFLCALPFHPMRSKRSVAVMTQPDRRGFMQYWLMKSEPDEVSIDDALSASGQMVPWVGVRNYQARNFMRDAMRVGDGVLFYHSSCAEPGIAGLAEVASTPYPDDTQFDENSKYYDPKATRENPRWIMVDVRATEKTRLMALAELRAIPELADMQILKRGNRLSITPVSPAEWRCIVQQLKS
jgi:predicted RNA-binding protein with PUA-like domain